MCLALILQNKNKHNETSSPFSINGLLTATISAFESLLTLAIAGETYTITEVAAPAPIHLIHSIRSRRDKLDGTFNGQIAAQQVTYSICSSRFGRCAKANRSNQRIASVRLVNRCLKRKSSTCLTRSGSIGTATSWVARLSVRAIFLHGRLNHINQAHSITIRKTISAIVDIYGICTICHIT
jgi:hypothetical protein